MIRISAAMRIALGLASLSMSVLLAAQTLGLVPDSEHTMLEGRKALCESVAMSCCLAAQREDMAAIQAITSALVTRNPAVVSVAVRRADGSLLHQVGPHGQQWKMADGSASTPNQAAVPIFQGKHKWGTVEVCFQPIQQASWLPEFMTPSMRLVMFAAAAGLLVFFWYLRRVLQHLDPSAVIPDRVRATLDTLVEGVLVLDKEQRIVLANQAFARHAGRSADELQGTKASKLGWNAASMRPEETPWIKAVREGTTQTGTMLNVNSPVDGERTFVVNSMPILGADGKSRGALATFDDVTAIEKKNQQLENMLQNLKESRDEIRRQNEELHILATRDPLTGCLNRRAFFGEFETQWQEAREHGLPMSCLMVDIDHFKSVNDNHGHSKGDAVLAQVSKILRGEARDTDFVCRYGGEEFCFLMPHTLLAEATVIAERIRSKIAANKCAELDVTISLGLSAIELGPKDPRELLDQADRSLYASKRNGRNRVTCFRDLPPDFEVASKPVARGVQVHCTESDIEIPFHAVTALFAALGYRDTLTGEHSRRVADLCVATAMGMMSQKECYVLEVAAMLHDIGKLGVPDAILLKPGPLTEDEWKIMKTHDRIGVEIITAAFSSPELTELVRTHHAVYGGNSHDPSLPFGDDIPLGARIITVVDSYDAMVSDRVYRKGRPRDAAFAELRRCAGTQFDPKVVERFIEVVTAQSEMQEQRALAVSKQTALRIGLQMERLASALDSRDYSNLSAMAGRLSATATKEGVPEIAELAAELEKCAATDPDLVTVVGLTTDLLDLCRATQKSYLVPVSPEED